MNKNKFICVLAGLALLFGGPGLAAACDPGNPTKGTITIKKIIVPTTSLKQKFDFSISGPTPLSFELAGGKSKTSTVAAGDYSLSEGEAGGWRLSSVVCKRNCVPFAVDSENVAFAIANGDVVACTFTNVALGRLKIVKKTAGGDGTFAFTSDNDEIDGTEISTSGGTGEAIISDLPPKTGYNVEEIALEGWNLTAADCSYGTPESFAIKAGKTTTCTFNNETSAAKSGKVIVKKVMVGGEDEFEFTGEVSGTISENGETLEQVVPAGVYDVTEEETEGWVLTGIECDDDDSSGDAVAATATFDVSEDETVTCVFTNAKAGKITVYKETLPAGDETLFSVTASGSGDIYSDAAQDLDINNPAVFAVAAGTYSVTEEDKAGWSEDDSDCQNISVAGGEERECTITNTLTSTTAMLTLGKTVISDDGGTALDTDWTLAASGPVIISGVEGQNEITDASVPAGDYELSEADGPDGYAAGDWECTGAAVVGGTVTLEDGDVAVCTMTNDDIRPTLTVFKQVVNGPMVAADFPLWVTPEGESAISINSGDTNDYEAGSYTVSETNNYPALYDKVAISGDCGADGSINLEPGDNAVCYIDNEDSNLARITVYKTVENNSGGTAAPADFDITVDADEVYAPATKAGSETGVVYYLEGGQTFAVIETGPDGYDITSMTGDCSGNISAGDDLECRIINSDRSSETTLTLVKEVINDNGGAAAASDWTLEAAGPTDISGATGAAAVTDAAVEPGVYALSETGPDGYDAGPWNCVINGGNPAEGDSVTLAAGDSAVCTITNDDIAPSLKLYKIVDCGVNISCAHNSCADASEFTLYATGGGTELSGNTPVESNGDFQADSYLLHEDGPMGYTGTWNCTGGVFDGTDTIALGVGQSAECTVTNVRSTTPPPVKYGTLKVIKVAVGGDSSQTFNFKGNKGIGAFALTPSNGSFGCTAKASWTSGNLAIGKYTITEKVPAGWKQVFNSCKNVRVKAGKQATCVIVNIKKICGTGCHTGCNWGCNYYCNGENGQLGGGSIFAAKK